MVCHIDKKAVVTTRYGMQCPPRTGGAEADPELGVSGSPDEELSIVALKAIISMR